MTIFVVKSGARILPHRDRAGPRQGQGMLSV
jgi:hypothetical protein